MRRPVLDPVWCCTARTVPNSASGHCSGARERETKHESRSRGVIIVVMPCHAVSVLREFIQVKLTALSVLLTAYREERWRRNYDVNMCYAWCEMCDVCRYEDSIYWCIQVGVHSQTVSSYRVYIILYMLQHQILISFDCWQQWYTAYILTLYKHLKILIHTPNFYNAYAIQMKLCSISLVCSLLV